MMDWVYCIVLGCIIGSFLNVCIYRIPAGESIVFPRSHCMTCGHTLGALELIPVLSYLGLKGQCKQCHSKISSRYMCIELITGMSFGISYGVYGKTMETVMCCTFCAFAIVLSAIDWEHMLLPTSIIRVGFLVGLVEYGIQGILLGQWYGVMEALLGALVGYILFMGLFYGSKWLLKKEALGYGDVRLMGLIGLFVGMRGLYLVLLISAILGSIYGIILLRIRKSSEPYPFGPFLNIGASITLLWGETIINGYLGLF